MPARARSRLVLTALALALVAAGCGEDESFRPDRVLTLSDGSRATDRGSAEASGGRAEVVMGEFYFRPTVLRAPAGTTLDVTLRNEGGNVHNFEVVAQRVDVTLAEGQREVVRVRVPDGGAVTFQCKFHLPRHMRGELRAS